MNREVPSDKRVGASVVVDANVQGMVSPYGYPPVAPGITPFPPVAPGIGIPNPCGCNIPFFPPVPFFPFPGFIDDRIERPLPPSRPIENVSLTVGVAPQSIASSTTAALLLTSAIASTRGIRISGSSIILPVEGVYTLSINITASRGVGVIGGDIMFILNGGISGSGFIASGDVASGQTRVFSGSITLTTNSPGTSISVLVNNDGGSLQILGGTITVQLVSQSSSIF